MEATFLILNLYCLVSILLSSGAHGVKIQAYRHKNFTGLLWESNSTAVCNNIPEDTKEGFYSIRTDTCFIVYYHPHCKSTWSQKYMPGAIVLFQWDLAWIESFQVCNEEEGGSQLNLDITKLFWSHDAFVIVPSVLESYKNVCSCVNVPQYILNMSKWSINNHHNALLAYYEPDCSEKEWNSKFVPAGNSDHSRRVQGPNTKNNVTKSFKYHSFGPDPNSTYFQTTCSSSHVTTTERSKTFESTIGIKMNMNPDLAIEFEKSSHGAADKPNIFSK